MKSEFKPLAEWIDKTFSVKTINIIYYTIDKGQRPALNICFEFESEKSKFHDKTNFNFHSRKTQAIGKQFKTTLLQQGLFKKKSLFDFSKNDNNSKYLTDNIWVVFSAFEPIAKAEANQSVPQEIVQDLKRQIDNKDIWDISNNSSRTTFFLYTKKQVEECNKNGVKEEWAEMYFNILTRYDEFGYFKKGLYSIDLDSKENFDKNYQSNWFYYYR